MSCVSESATGGGGCGLRKDAIDRKIDREIFSVC